ncbi:MAG: hypothetical protein TREMPRED_005652 [Tremellales sp. Tagirdzhanova-0007]|nr:MAG: hypothetical protein TREMPRED_005652 [Tremellales sp. Tagirdzhanova-0007]
MSIISTSFPNTAPEPSNPRRIVLSHDPETGAPAIIDNEEPIIHGESGQTFCTAYTQKDFIGRPELALEGASRKPDQGFIQTTGVSAGFIDIAPGQDFSPHFCNTVDYLIIVKGSIELGLMDGTWRSVEAGAMIVNFASAHRLKNASNEWCRFAVVAVPCEPQLVKGRPLSEEPFKALEIK